MSIATDKLLQSSDRYVLARLEPARYVNDDLVSIGGGQYQASLQDFDNISKVERNGATLTLVTTIAGNDQYTFDENTRLITMQLASAPNEDSNVIIVFHYLYLTTIKGRCFPSDPLSAKSPSNPIRYWEPRIARTPQIEESYSNIINAVMTIKSSSLSINNADRYINPFTGLNDSFKNKTLDIYIGINDSLDKLYTGPMNDISLSNDSASVKFRDAFSKVNDLATFGDDNIYYTEAEYSLLDPQAFNRPKVFAIGTGTVARTIPYGSAASTSTLAFPDKSMAVLSGFNKAVNIDYATDTATSGNRTHHCYKAQTTIDTQTLGTMVRRTTSTIRGDTVHHFFFSAHNLKVGQTFKWDDGGGPYYAIVHHVGTYDIGGSDYNVLVANNGTINLTDPQMTSTAQFDPLRTFVCIRAQDVGGTFSTYSSIFLKQETQYTISESIATLPTGTIVEIDLDSSISFDVDTDTVYYSAEFSDFGQAGHGSFTRTLLSLAGISVPSYSGSTFEDADTQLPLDLRTQIPKFNDTTIPIYRSVLEDILGSALTYLYQDKDGVAQYGVLEAIASGDSRDNNTILSEITSALSLNLASFAILIFPLSSI